MTRIVDIMAAKEVTPHYHPAKDYSFADLFSALEDCVTQGAAIRRTCKGTDPEHPEYTLYSYKSITTANWRETPALALARGIVLCEETQTIEVLPFEKFFNHNEHPPKCKYRTWTVEAVEDKYDGSLGIAFFDKRLDEWRMITRGSFISPQSAWGQTELHKLPGLVGLDRDVTWMFEIICEKSRVVVQYETEHLRLLSGYNTKTFQEIPRDELERVAASLGVPVAERLDHLQSLDAVHDHLKESHGLETEGYVVRFRRPDGVMERRKVKGASYKALHAALSDISRARVHSIMIFAPDAKTALTTVQAYAVHQPEEHTKVILDWAQEIADKFDELHTAFAADMKSTGDMSQKELGLAIKNSTHDFKLPTKLQRLLFTARKSSSIPVGKLWEHC